MAEAVALSLLVVEQAIKLISNLRSPRSVGHDVNTAKDFLERMREYLNKSPEAEVDEARAKQIRGVAYSIEDALDEYFLRIPNHSHTFGISRIAHRRASSEFASNMAKVVKQFDSILKIDELIRQPKEGRSSTCQEIECNSSSSAPSCHPEEIVGFEIAEEKLMKQIMEVNSRRLAISIVGPAGSGKTTLVKSVYKSNQVRGFFDCHAWIDLPRPFEFNKVLRSMLRKLDQESINQEDTNDMKQRLERVLSKKRFMIVLDNIRSKEELESVANVLPNGLHGSKIISTSCNSLISSSISSSEYRHDLSTGLPRKQAWSLFCNKALHKSEGNCPKELHELAQNIFKKCEGLPLAISEVGAALATKDQTTREWKSFHDSLGSHVPILRKRWEPSYKDLPNNLTTCFLYFGMFPQDYSISRDRLIRLWIAEGFVIPDERRTLEKVAEDYLEELVERNLVVVTDREINGRVKLCRVLNLVREFIIPKAKHYITVLDANSREIIDATQGNEIRRLSVQCNIHIGLFDKLDLSHLRTLLVFGDLDEKTTTYNSSGIHKVLEACRLLKVLDLQGTSSLENFPKSIERLTLLRYLNLSETQVKTIPSSIKNLGFLETLNLKQTKVTTLPQEIDRLQSLRDLLAYRYDHNNYVTFGSLQGVHVSAGCNLGSLTRMQKLSLIRVPVRKNRKFIEALGELKSLKRLGLRDLREEDGAKLCVQVMKMKDLSTFDVQSTSEDEVLDLDHMTSPPFYLQHLYMKGRLQSIPRWVFQLHSLVKVGLKWSKLKAEVNPFEALENLPNLMKLELVNYYLGEEITFKAATFKKLVVLVLDQFEELNFMAIESNAMPMLEKLTMSRCHNLRLLPVIGFGDLKSLKEVLLYDMCPDFVSNFERDGEDREVFQHVGTIKSFSLKKQNANFSGYKNLSPSQWSVRS